MPFGIVCRVCFAEFPSQEALEEHRQVHAEPESSKENVSEHARRFREHLRGVALQRFNTYVPDPSPWNLQPMAVIDAVESEETREYERRKREFRATMRVRFETYVPDPTPYVTQPMAVIDAVESEEAQEYEREKNRRRHVDIPYVRPHWQTPQELARDDFLLKTCVFQEKTFLDYRSSEPMEDAYDTMYHQITPMRNNSVNEIRCQNPRCQCNDPFSQLGYYCGHIWDPESASDIAERMSSSRS